MALAIPGSGISPVDVAEPLEGPFVSGLAEAARENEIYIVCGIFESKVDDGGVHIIRQYLSIVTDKLYNLIKRLTYTMLLTIKSLIPLSLVIINIK